MSKYARLAVGLLRVMRSRDALRTATVVGILMLALFRWFQVQDRSTPPRATGIQAGDQLVNIRRLGISGSQTALLLITASTCHFCQQSMPFYQALVPVAKRAGVRLVGAAEEAPSTNADLFSAHGIALDAIIRSDEVGILGAPTPTLVLVGGDGVVQKTWVGSLLPQMQRDVLQSLR
ncbi:MAG TPA: hypothetical protein VHW45_00725 [Candidatus Sulfotelmatobacter sp.]|jgi:hypothetical protein|nr:hypothetical protein [Candidatus Sulfotelmatobacter sp.]